jgi:hypothetical protein
MYAKLKPKAIPTARVNMNVFPIAGLNGPETIKSPLKQNGCCTCQLIQH